MRKTPNNCAIGRGVGLSSSAGCSSCDSRSECLIDVVDDESESCSSGVAPAGISTDRL